MRRKSWCGTWLSHKSHPGRVGILLPDGLLGNPGDEYERWWILRYCEVLASVDLPVELIDTEHPEYKVFMAVVDRHGGRTKTALGR